MAYLNHLNYVDGANSLNGVQDAMEFLERARQDAKIAAQLQNAILSNSLSEPPVHSEIYQTPTVMKVQSNDRVLEAGLPLAATLSPEPHFLSPVNPMPIKVINTTRSSNRFNDESKSTETMNVDVRGLGTRRPYFIHFHKAGGTTLCHQAR